MANNESQIISVKINNQTGTGDIVTCQHNPDDFYHVWFAN
jgi:hypothetical protein